MVDFSGFSSESFEQFIEHSGQKYSVLGLLPLVMAQMAAGGDIFLERYPIHFHR